MTARLRLTLHAAIASLAAASALMAVYSGGDWLPPVAGGIFVVAATSELVRRSPLPAALGPVLSAATMSVYLTLVYAHDSAYAAIVPTGSSMQVLADLARDGFSDARVLATPVPTNRGLVLLAVVGLAAVELVVDLLAVTMRRAALAGLPLLAVFAICTSTAKHGVGWLPFVIGTAGYLWLLLADSRDRLATWGRTLGYERSRVQARWADPDVTPSPLSVLGRRIGATAIAIGVVVPLLVPGLHGGLPKTGPGTGGTGHGSTVVTVNPIVSVAADLQNSENQPVLSMRSTSNNPGYLRLTSLDKFDGTTFSPSSLNQGAQSRVSNGINAPAVDGTESSTTRITVQDLNVYWLPVPVQVTKVDASGDWRYDEASNTVFSARSTTRRLTYTVTSLRPDPAPAELRQSVLPDPSAWRQYLQLPSDISPEIRTLAKQVTETAKTPFDEAVAIQTFLTRAPFTYDPTVPADASSSALADFLLKTHRGFCQQYASAMAVLARILGIPSRVAVGFTHGQPQSDGSWLVSTHDAHAWPELYFPISGWIAFEPTPRAGGEVQAPAYTRPSPNGPGQGNEDPSTTAPSAAPTPDSDALGAKKDRDNSAAVTLPPEPGQRQDGSHLAVWILLGLLALALASPAGAHAWSRHLRWRGAQTPEELAHAAWDELRARSLDSDAGWIDGLTPRATARLLEAQTPLGAEAAAALQRIVQAEQRARYAPRPAAVDTSLRLDVETIHRAMVADLRPARRLLLAIWPRSTLMSLRRLIARVADLLDAFDVGGARARVWVESIRARRGDAASALRAG